MAETYYALTDLIRLCDKTLEDKPISFSKGIVSVRDALIYHAPAADVGPVVHAHWGRGSEDGRRECSHCGMYEHERNYCGFCGAKMDESEDEDNEHTDKN